MRKRQLQLSLLDRKYGICVFENGTPIPEWVATDESLLELTHALVLDQGRRGQGYPVALSEAHEQAVVTGADRENFWQLVEASLVDEKLPSPTSAKSFSKRTRWV